jgi:hypothetical protein
MFRTLAGRSAMIATVSLTGCIPHQYFPATTSTFAEVPIDQVTLSPDHCEGVEIIGYVYAQGTDLPGVLKTMRSAAAEAGAQGLCAIETKEGSTWAALYFGLMAFGSTGPFHVRATAFRGTVSGAVRMPPPPEPADTSDDSG